MTRVTRRGVTKEPSGGALVGARGALRGQQLSASRCASSRQQAHMLRLTGDQRPQFRALFLGPNTHHLFSTAMEGNLPKTGLRGIAWLVLHHILCVVGCAHEIRRAWYRRKRS